MSKTMFRKSAFMQFDHLHISHYITIAVFRYIILSVPALLLVEIFLASKVIFVQSLLFLMSLSNPLLETCVYRSCLGCFFSKLEINVFGSTLKCHQKH